jgi:hypothetical protein
MAIQCDPQALAQAGACYCYGDRKSSDAVIIYLLAQIAGDNSTPSDLAKKAACLCFADAPTRDAVLLYLLCQIANGGGGGVNVLDDPGPMDMNVEGSTVLTGAVTMPNLTSDFGDFGIGFVSCNNITSLSFPFLTTLASQLLVVVCPSLTSVGAPLLSSAGSISLYSNPLLTSLVFPELVTVSNSMQIYSMASLTSFSAPNWVPTDGTTINFTGCALDATSVEAFLHQCVLAGVTTCTIDLSGGTNAGLTSLNAQGQADAATLGVQLTINP